MLFQSSAVQDQSDASPGSPTKAPAHSPVKGVMAALSKHRVSQEPLSSLHKPVKKIEGMDIPEKIEDVPFRRQDRRILNARKKRIIAKRIICFGITTCLTFLGLGIALIVIYCLFQKDKEFWFVDSFLILGIMVVICAIMFGAFTIETCISLRRAIARVQDKEIDKISNLHLVKHWIEPDLIPYGWGHDNDGMNNHEPGVPLLDQAILKDDNVYAGNHQLLRVHQIDSLQIEEVGTDEDEIVHVSNMKAQIEATSEDNLARQSPIPKDIFDESLRYSAVDRPKLSVITSAPLPPRRGSFEDPNEKIANLFNSMNSTRT